MINDAALVDALDDFRASATPAVLTWVTNMAKAARLQSQSAEDIAGFEALLGVVRAISAGTSLPEEK